MNTQQRALFLDRDGVINVDHGYVFRQEDFEFIDGIFDLCRTAAGRDFLIFVVTNQAGIGRGYYSTQQFHEVSAWMCQQFLAQGVTIEHVYFCPYHAEHGVGEYRQESFFRKPNPGMILQAAQEYGLDLPSCVLVGDKVSDIAAAAAAGVGTKILFRPKDPSNIPPGTLVVDSLREAEKLIAASNEMPVKQVTAIVVNWNGGQLLEESLRGLTRQSLPPARILVIDNGSTDGSAELAEKIPGVTVRKTGENLGFAAGNNRALEECDTEFVALLNPDALPDPDWLANLVAAAEAYPDAASFGSRQMMHGEPDRLDGIGDVYHFSGAVWRDRYGRVQREEDTVAKEIFCACAAAVLYRRDALLDVGGFDEDFFCYVEDVDLGFRLRLAGYTSRYVPDAVVHHVGSACTGGQNSDFSVYHGHRNLVWAFIKNMPGFLFWVLLPAHILLNLVAIGHFIKHGQAQVILRSKWDALKGIAKMWRKRRTIQANRRAKIADIWRALGKRIPKRRKK